MGWFKPKKKPLSEQFFTGSKRSSASTPPPAEPESEPVCSNWSNPYDYVYPGKVWFFDSHGTHESVRFISSACSY